MKGIVVDSIKKTYISKEGFRKKRVVEALKGVSLTVGSGEIHALLGPNGAGKSTLVKILATLLLPDSGRAYVDGYDVVREAEKVRRVIGIVLDVSKGFYTSLSGYENLVFYALLKGYSYQEARRRAKEVLELVGLYEMNAHNRPYYTYSLGMRARLSIAKALLTNPPVLLLDEPTLGLDVESAKAVRKLITDLAKEGRTVLITGHNMHEIEQIASSITIIDSGRVIVSGNPSELKAKLGLMLKVSTRIEGLHTPQILEKIKSFIPIEKASIEPLDSSTKIVFYTKASREEVVQSIMQMHSTLDLKILDLVVEEPTLEDAYIAVVGEGHGH
ncbi:MAG: ABC transporter ATP-binding protein [Ignisphaera sp.]